MGQSLHSLPTFKNFEARISTDWNFRPANIQVFSLDFLAILSSWRARFGTPLWITSDQGRQFESHLFKELNNLLGTKHLRTSAYHPASNGLVERLHHLLKAAIRCHANERWTETLPIILLGLRAAWREDLQAIVAEVLYGESLRRLGEFLAPKPNLQQQNETSEFVRQIRKYFQDLSPVGRTSYNKHKPFVFKDLATTDQVFLRRDKPGGLFDLPYDGPYSVNSRNDKTFDVSIKGKSITVTIDRLKPVYTIAEEDLQKEAATHH
ncbi:uncharacterized protein LOC117176635 [Belonocnema kinseyi]|uniref:uncharacterized protein LOC117176635 n=1 Tax=Belonocnema kinseyi TaxID=2817044 RepID=UPI00143D1110|nr:uncharacterized protein LOC117176635 [Belonocnema kinseyi]